MHSVHNMAYITSRNVYGAKEKKHICVSYSFYGLVVSKHTYTHNALISLILCSIFKSYVELSSLKCCADKSEVQVNGKRSTLESQSQVSRYKSANWIELEHWNVPDLKTCTTTELLYCMD